MVKQKLTTNCIIVVKYDNGGGQRPWVEYKAKKGRSLDLLQYTFGNNAAFRFAQIYEYNKETKTRGHKVGYFDRKTIDY